MKIPHIAQQVAGEPWLIIPHGHAAVRKVIEARILSAPTLAREPGTDICGSKVEVEQAELRDDIMHIPIGGILGQGLTGFDRGSGAVDTLDIAKELEMAEQDDRVRAIFVDFDSPGGTVQGTPELADLIAQINKPIYSFSRGQICSAAYWLAAATDGIFCTKTADIGSIGVYIPWMDVTEYYKQAGVKIQLFTSGKYKGMGYPGTPLTEDQQRLLNDRVNYIAEMFYTQVRSNRPDVPAEAMQGQTFMGEKALENGLVDGIVASKEEAISMI